IEVAVDGGDAEGGEAGRNARVGEGAGDVYGLEVRIEDVHRARVEVGGEEESPVGVEALGEPLVDGTRGRVVHRDNSVGRIDGAVPAGDGAVLGGEQLGARGRLAGGGNDEPRRSVRGDAGGRRGSHAAGGRDRDGQGRAHREGLAGAVIGRGHA